MGKDRQFTSPWVKSAAAFSQVSIGLLLGQMKCEPRTDRMVRFESRVLVMGHFSPTVSTGQGGLFLTQAKCDREPSLFLTCFVVLYLISVELLFKYAWGFCFLLNTMQLR